MNYTRRAQEARAYNAPVFYGPSASLMLELPISAWRTAYGLAFISPIAQAIEQRTAQTQLH